jgi:acetylornithine deacetylase
MQPKTAKEILSQLVSFDTTSSGSNMALIEWVERYLAPCGAHIARVHETNEHGVQKSALLVRIGPAVEGGIVLSGHTDVVPVVGQIWHEGRGEDTAFRLREHAGKLYGRGAADMKGFIATALAQVPHWGTQDLKRPVWLALSYDEEIGCKCAEPMAIAFTKHTIKPQLIIVGEPTMMRVVDEHKGIDSFETVITGKAGHSSAPDAGINAAYIAAHITLAIEQMNAVERMKADPDSPFPTPYSTVHAGIVEAGTARNIIPDHAVIRWEVRPLPGANVDDITAPLQATIEALQKHYPGCMIETKRLTHVHGLKKLADDAPYLTLATHLAGSNVAPSAVSYGTEGGAYGEHGFPTVICGPGDIAQAHGPDEFIAIEQLEKSIGMMHRVGEVLVRG